MSEERDEGLEEIKDILLNLGYKVLNLLADGSFSRVFTCLDVKNNEKVAIKIIVRKEISKRVKEMLKKEVEIMKTLKHPNIVQLKMVHDSNKEYLFIVQEKADNDLFDEIIKNELDEESVFKYFSQLVNALEFLHSKNIIHRKLSKQQNNMMEPCQIFGALVMSTRKNPFIHRKQERKSQILKNMLSENILFPINIDPLVKKLVKRMLKCDPSKRISLRQIRSSKWFKKENKKWGSVDDINSVYPVECKRKKMFGNIQGILKSLKRVKTPKNLK